VDTNFNDLSLKELKDMQSQIAKAISSFEDRRKRQALAELEDIVRAKGFSSLAELTGAPTPRKTTASVAKYANPANRSDTWSGRGRKPRWFIEAMAAGRKPEELSV
jgi:DNA-binding protein H-NS